MRVGIAGVAKNHPQRVRPVENVSHATHVGGKVRRRHTAVFDELHAAQPRRELRQNGARRVPQCPQAMLGFHVIGLHHRCRTLPLAQFRELTEISTNLQCVLPFYFAEQHGLAFAWNTGGAAAFGHIQKGAIEQLTG